MRFEVGALRGVLGAPNGELQPTAAGLEDLRDELGAFGKALAQIDAARNAELGGGHEPATVATPIPPEPRPTDHLPRLAALRAQQIERLVAYRAAGEYSSDAAGIPIGVFRDAAGRHCPMAHLIHLSGRDDLVDETARTNNTLQLADVHDGPLLAWMLDSGLTQEEIVMVQGVMEPGFSFGNEQVFLDERALIAHLREEVGKRLDTVIATLRIQTSQSLDVAVARR